EAEPSPKALAERAREVGCWALALTDTNTLAGAVEHVEACRAAGVKPLVGFAAWWVNSSGDVSGGGSRVAPIGSGGGPPVPARGVAEAEDHAGAGTHEHPLNP